MENDNKNNDNLVCNLETEVIEVDLNDSNSSVNKPKFIESPKKDKKKKKDLITNLKSTHASKAHVAKEDPLMIAQKKKRIIILVILGLAIITGVLSTVIYMTSSKTIYLLYCLELNEENYIPFRTSSNSLFVILVIIAFLFISTIVMLIKGHFSLIESYLKDTHPYLSISLITLMGSFLIADFTTDRTLVTILLNLILALIGLLSMTVIIYKVNKRKFSDKLTIINECFLASILCALIFYALLFNLVSMISGISDSKKKYDKTNAKYAFNIISNVIYFLSALLFLTLYKDIVYPSCAVIIETGLISNKAYYFSEILTSIVVVVLTFFTVVLTVFKFKYKVFRISIQPTMF